MEIKQLWQFLKLLETPNTTIQFSDLNTVIPPFELTRAKTDLYFLAGVKKGTIGRAKDSDIIEKNYMGFDFDLTKDKGWNPEQIKAESKAALEFLKDDKSPLSKVMAVVFSGGGIHIYYKTPLVTNFDNWRGIYEQAQAKLEQLTGWKADGACKNPGRIMRLPESFSVKRGVLTEVLYLNEGAEPIFTLEAYEKFKKPTAKVAPKSELKIKLFDLNSHSIRALDNKKMLELLSGHDLVGGEVYSFRTRASGGEYIDVDEKPANAWLDKEGKIGSGSKAGPTWVEWLSYYGKTEKDAFVFLYEQGISELTEPEKPGYEIDAPTKIFTWGTSRLDYQLSPITPEQSNLLTGNSSAGKTTYAFDVAWKNAKMGHRVLYLSLEMSRQEIESRLARAYAGITKGEWRDRKTISEDKKAKFKHRVDELKNLKNLILSGIESPTLENIFKLIRGTAADLVFLDNFDLIEKRPGQSTYNEENRISAALKDFPKKFGIPIIILHHRGKAKGFSLDGVRGSGKITHDRYTALRCEREYLEDGTEEQNAQFYLVEEKDRDFGHSKRNLVYFKNGSFYDRFE